MRVFHTEDNHILIDGDEALLAKIEGQSLAGVDVSDFRICAESLAELYKIASVRKSTDHIKRFALMKQLYQETGVQ